MMTSKDELRLQVGHKLHDYGVRGQDNDYLTDYVLNLLESEKQKARESTLTVALHTMKDIFRRLWMYEVIYGGVKDMDNRDITKEFEEYQKLEPTRLQFADWYEAKLATLNKEPNKSKE